MSSNTLEIERLMAELAASKAELAASKAELAKKDAELAKKDTELAADHETKDRMKDCRTLRKDIDALPKRHGDAPYYENQRKVGQEIAANITCGGPCRFHRLRAFPQVGKAGATLATIDMMLRAYEAGEYNDFNPRALYALGNTDAKGWVNQTCERFPKMMRQQNICHRSKQRKSLFHEDAVMRNAVIFVDEAHVASKVEMTFDKVLTELGFKDYEEIINQNVHIVMITATWMRLSDDFEAWRKAGLAKSYELSAGEGYTGIAELLAEGRVHPYRNLYDDPTAVSEVFDAVETYYAPGPPLYHIVRTNPNKKGDLVCRFREEAARRGLDYGMYEVNATGGDHTNLVDVLKIPPPVHSFLFIKSMAREAITLPKDNLGLLYENKSRKPDETTIVQSLAGRACGYDVPKRVRVFSDVQLLQHYCDHKSGEGTSDGRQSYIEPGTYVNKPVLVVADKKYKSDKINRMYRVFASDIEAAAFIKERFKANVNKRTGKAPKDLLQSDGRNPTLDYLINRWWGFWKHTLYRMTPIDTGEWVVQWVE
jgi:hypothetical protein